MRMKVLGIWTPLFRTADEAKIQVQWSDQWQMYVTYSWTIDYIKAQVTDSLFVIQLNVLMLIYCLKTSFKCMPLEKLAIV